EYCSGQDKNDYLRFWHLNFLELRFMEFGRSLKFYHRRMVWISPLMQQSMFFKDVCEKTAIRLLLRRTIQDASINVPRLPSAGTLGSLSVRPNSNGLLIVVLNLQQPDQS